MYDDSDIADLITEAHGKGMQVYAAYGDSDWPTLGCPVCAFPMQRMTEVAAYNAANRSVRFDGVVLDVEPSGTPDFPALLALYQCFQQQAKANGMGLSVAISAFWDTTVTSGSVAPGELIAIFGVNLGPATKVLQIVGEKLTTNLGGRSGAFRRQSRAHGPGFLRSARRHGAFRSCDQFHDHDSSRVRRCCVRSSGGAHQCRRSWHLHGKLFRQRSRRNLNQNYSDNNSSNPATAGSVVMLYLTGAGQMTPAGVDGSVNLSPAGLSQAALPVTAQIGGLPAAVLYAGSSEGIVSGVIQVNLVMPNGLSAGPQPVTVEIGGVATQAGVTVAVQ
jgi:hypothetical protein